MVNFQDILKRKSQEELAKMADAADKAVSGGFVKDERYWRPVTDQAGNGGAIIRFLPVAPADYERNPQADPWVQRYSYSFQNPENERWFIELSPQTIKKPCPVSELWAKQKKDTPLYKLLARSRKFVSNIYIVKHPARPDDEGKVFLYEYGKTIYEKIRAKMEPNQNLGKAGFDPFHLVEGANFYLQVTKRNKFPNYENSEFDSPGPLSDDVQLMKRIWESEYSLMDEVGPEKFKSYEDLKHKLNEVLELSDDAPKVREPAPAPAPTKAATMPWDDQPDSKGDDEPSEDDAAFLRNLAARSKKVG